MGMDMLNEADGCYEEEEKIKEGEKETDNGDIMNSIIDLQRSSGAFQWGSVLEKALKISKMDADKAAKDNGGLEVWVTALIIVYFKLKMTASKDLWELVVEKATKFVEKNSQGKTHKILQNAEGVIKAI